MVCDPGDGHVLHGAGVSSRIGVDVLRIDGFHVIRIKIASRIASLERISIGIEDIGDRLHRGVGVVELLGMMECIQRHETDHEGMVVGMVISLEQAVLAELLRSKTRDDLSVCSEEGSAVDRRPR